LAPLTQSPVVPFRVPGQANDAEHQPAVKFPICGLAERFHGDALSTLLSQPSDLGLQLAGLSQRE
jgi:hypothetical protein